MDIRVKASFCSPVSRDERPTGVSGVKPLDKGIVVTIHEPAVLKGRFYIRGESCTEMKMPIEGIWRKWTSVELGTIGGAKHVAHIFLNDQCFPLLPLD